MTPDAKKEYKGTIVDKIVDSHIGFCAAVSLMAVVMAALIVAVAFGVWKLLLGNRVEWAEDAHSMAATAVQVGRDLRIRGVWVLPPATPGEDAPKATLHRNGNRAVLEFRDFSAYRSCESMAAQMRELVSENDGAMHLVRRLAPAWECDSDHALSLHLLDTAGCS